jgi:hypothetical protein
MNSTATNLASAAALSLSGGGLDVHEGDLQLHTSVQRLPMTMRAHSVLDLGDLSRQLRIPGTDSHVPPGSHSRSGTSCPSAADDAREWLGSLLPQGERHGHDDGREEGELRHE